MDFLDEWIAIFLPDRLFYNGGREEYTSMMCWLEEHCGVIAIDWDQAILKRILYFKREEDLVAFKLKFNI